MRKSAHILLSSGARFFVFLLSLILLVACSSQPTTVKYYILSQNDLKPAEASAHNVSGNNTVVLVESVKVARFLRQPGLVLQQGNNQIHISKSNLWAEPLEDSLPRFVLSTLKHQEPLYRYQQEGQDLISTAKYSLRIQINAMQAKDNGEVLLAGNYMIQKLSGNGRTVLKDFYFEKMLLESGHAYAISQIEVLLVLLAEDIVQNLARIDQ